MKDCFNLTFYSLSFTSQAAPLVIYRLHLLLCVQRSYIGMILQFPLFSIHLH